MIVKYIGDYSKQNYIDWNLNFRIKVNILMDFPSGLERSCIVSHRFDSTV